MPTLSRAVRAAETKNHPPAPNPPSPLVRAGIPSGGQTLDKHTQATMSARFGHDFSQVRIHTDSRAGASADALGASAFAHGSDIVFGPGQYTPGSPATERLLAHELTHVVQQSQLGGGDWGRVSREEDASEREADVLSEQVVMGQSVQAQAAPQAAVARRPTGPLGNFLPKTPPQCEHPLVWHTPDGKTVDSQGHPVDYCGFALQDHRPDTASQPAPAPDMNMMSNPNAYHPDLAPSLMRGSGPAVDMMSNPGGYHPDLGPDRRLMTRPAPAPHPQSAAAMPPPTSAPDSSPSLASTLWDIATDNTLGSALSMGEEGIKATGGSPGVLAPINKYGGPVGMLSNILGYHKHVQDGQFGDAALDAAAFTGSTISTAAGFGAIEAAGPGAATALGITEAGSVLNPVGAAAAVGVGAYAGNTKLKGLADDYSVDKVLYGRGDDGEARNTTEAAGDAGIAVSEGVHSLAHHIPVVGDTLGDIVGGQMGAETAMVSSVGTEAYAGIHALGSYLFGGSSDNAPLAEPGAGAGAEP